MAQSNSISVSPTSLAFCVAANNSPAPPAQTLTVSSNVSTPLGFNANAFPNWVRLNGQILQNGVIVPSSIVGNTSSAPTITVTIDPSAYNGGGAMQSGTVQIQSGNDFLTVNVSVTVTATCANASTLSATPSSVSLFTNQTSQLVAISGPSGAQLTATPFYGTNNPTGWFTLSASSLVTGQSVTVSLATTNLASGTAGSILFTQTGTNNSVSVPVTFTTGGTGNGVFTANPNSIGVTFASSLSAQQIQGVTITGPAASLSSSVSLGSGPSGWLTATQPAGPTPVTTIQVTVNPANLPTGTTNGFVTVSQNGTNNFVTIPVSATVGTGGYTYSPSPFNLTATGGSATVQNQTLTINGPNNAQVTANATINNGGYQWLSFSGSTTTNGTLTNSTLQLLISVYPVNLAPSQTYTGTIVVASNGSNVLSIPVTLTTAGASTLTFTPTQLNFAWQIGTAAPSVQTITVTSPAGTQLNFTPSESTSNCGNWLVVQPVQTTATNGTTGTLITASINTVPLPSTTTTCSGNIQVSAPQASNPTTNIPVSLLVSVNPLLLVAPTSLTFNAQPGGGTPGSQTVQVTSSSSSTQLPFTYFVNPGTTGAPIFLSISQNTTTTPATLTVSINPNALAQLGPNTYVDNVVVSSTAAGNPSITIPVTLTVSNTATLVATPTQITMNYEIGQQAPVSQTITVSSTGAPITFTPVAASTSCSNFLSIFPTSTLSTLASSGQNGTQINVSASVSGLTSPTVCSGTITLTPAGSSTSTVVNVTLNVVSQAVINVGLNNITQTAPSGSTTPITVFVPVSSTDNVTSIGFTATISTTPAGQQWLSIIGANALSTAANLQVQLNPTNLPPGQYAGTLTIFDQRSGSPVPSQTIPVTLIVAGQATANPTSLTFITPLNGSNPATQTITVGGVPSTSAIGATPSTSSCGTQWLTANVSGNTVVVGIVNSNLTVSIPTTCFGTVAIIVPGATPNPLIVGVTLTVTSTTLSLSSGLVTFNYVAGSGAIPTSQTVQLTATGSTNVNFSAAFTPSTTSTPAGLVTISPPAGTTAGTTPTTLSISLSQTSVATLGPGTYGGTVTVSSPNLASVTLNVTVTVILPPPPALTSVVSGATLQPGAVSPGEIISIFGTNIGPATSASLTLTSAGKVSTTLGGAQVLFDNNFAAPLIYVSANQINAIVPY